MSHGNSSMRIGTDAVLLAAWMNLNRSEKILEVGTGSGVISLILAQRSPKSMIEAIDIHPESIQEASQNFKNSPWPNNLNAKEISFQALAQENQVPFDTIISNPPFFINSMPSPKASRHAARHTDELTPFDFFDCSNVLLKANGKIGMILPYNSLNIWLKESDGFGFKMQKITKVYSYPGKPIERVLIEFSRKKAEQELTEIFIREGKNMEYTEAYRILTGEYYL